MAAFVAEGTKTNRPRLLLTAAVSAGKGTIDSGYQIAQIGQFVYSSFSYFDRESTVSHGC